MSQRTCRTGSRCRPAPCAQSRRSPGRGRGSPQCRCGADSRQPGNQSKLRALVKLMQPAMPKQDRCRHSAQRGQARLPTTTHTVRPHPRPLQPSLPSSTHSLGTPHCEASWSRRPTMSSATCWYFLPRTLRWDFVWSAICAAGAAWHRAAGSAYQAHCRHPCVCAS